MDGFDPAAIIVAISTAVLSGITFVYMIETRRIRVGSELPSFSLEPSTYILGGGFLGMDLVNSGKTATEIRLDCTWENDSKKLFVISLGLNGHVPLHGIPIPSLAQKGMKLLVTITCKDLRGKNYEAPKIEIDFGKVKSENRQVAYQYNPMQSAEEYMKEIARELRSINTNLSATGRGRFS